MSLAPDQLVINYANLNDDGRKVLGKPWRNTTLKMEKLHDWNDKIGNMYTHVCITLTPTVI
jgi:hypothetical protein